MTRPQRSLHLILVTVLAIPTLVLAIISLSNRQQIPVSNISKSEDKLLSSLEFIASNDDLYDEFKINLVFYDDNNSNNRFIRVKLNDHLIYPDILVYIASDIESGFKTIPINAILLGQLSYQSINLFELPNLNSKSTLILYSLGQQKIISSLQFEADSIYQSEAVN